MEVEFSMEKHADTNWKLAEGRVNTEDDHFKVMYGNEDSPVALVGRSKEDCFTVELLIDGRKKENGSQKILEKVRQEIDLVLVKKNKKDPWAYALLRCCTNNHHSEIRWGYFPKR